VLSHPLPALSPHAAAVRHGHAQRLRFPKPERQRHLHTIGDNYIVLLHVAILHAGDRTLAMHLQ